MGAQITWYYKLINLLNFVFVMQDIFTVIIQTSPLAIIKELFILLWNDLFLMFQNL